jgi:hypothetical protein
MFLCEQQILKESHLSGLHEDNPHFDNPFVIESTRAAPSLKTTKPLKKKPNKTSVPSSFGDYLVPQQQKYVDRAGCLALRECRKTKFSEMGMLFSKL